jgi:hypothetical protein
MQKNHLTIKWIIDAPSSQGAYKKAKPSSITFYNK